MNSVRAGTGWTSAAGVVTTTSEVPAVASKAPGDRVDRSFDSTINRSLEAVNASRMSRRSASDSGKTRTSNGRGSSAAA